MSTVSRVNGFRPVKHINGAPYTGQANLYFVPASDSSVIMVGDTVKLLTGATRSPTGALSVTRTATAASDVNVGVVVGILFTGVGDVQNVPPVTNLNTPVYRAASTDRYVLVADSPDLIFEAQVSSNAFVTANVGKNVAMTLTAGSTTTGVSGMQIDQSTIATTNTLPFQLVGFPYRPDNNVTSSQANNDAFVSAYVRFNTHQFRTATGSTGV